LFQIFVLGKSGEAQERPFKEPANPLASMLGNLMGTPADSTSEAAAAAPSPVADAPASSTTTAPATTTEQRKSQKQKLKTID